MPSITSGWPNPHCLQCRRAQACPVHAAMSPDTPQPHPHCYGCNGGTPCEFHAKPAQQEDITRALAGKPPRGRRKQPAPVVFIDPNDDPDYNPFCRGGEDEFELLRQKQLAELAKSRKE